MSWFILSRIAIVKQSISSALAPLAPSSARICIGDSANEPEQPFEIAYSDAIADVLLPLPVVTETDHTTFDTVDELVGLAGESFDLMISSLAAANSFDHFNLAAQAKAAEIELIKVVSAEMIMIQLMSFLGPQSLLSFFEKEFVNRVIRLSDMRNLLARFGSGTDSQVFTLINSV